MHLYSQLQHSQRMSPDPATTLFLMGFPSLVQVKRTCQEVSIWLQLCMPRSQLVFKNPVHPTPPQVNKFRTFSRLFWGRGVCSAVVRDRLDRAKKERAQGKSWPLALIFIFKFNRLALVSFQLLYLLQPFLSHLKEEKENFFQVGNVLFSVSHSCEFHRASCDQLKKMCEFFFL